MSTAWFNQTPPHKLRLYFVNRQTIDLLGTRLVIPPYLRSSKSQHFPTSDLQIAISSFVTGCLFFGFFVEVVPITFDNNLDLFIRNAVDEDGKIYAMLFDLILRCDHNVGLWLSKRHCAIPNLDGCAAIPVTSPE